METNLDSKKALSYLKAGYVLRILNEERIVFEREGKIVVKGENSHIVVNEYAFLSIFSETMFVPEDDLNDEDTIDPQRDKEYYSWRQ